MSKGIPLTEKELVDLKGLLRLDRIVPVGSYIFKELKKMHVYHRLLRLPAIIILLLLVIIPLEAEAADISSGDVLTVEVAEIIDDDLYYFGDTVIINGTVLGDAIIFCREATIDGKVEGSLLVFAETIRINGEIVGSARGGANSLIFQGSTERDLMMAANTASISGLVGNDLFIGASSANLTGEVGRDIRASINRLTVDGPVGGDIKAYVNELIFGSSAKVGGKVTYTSENEADVSSEAIISGTLDRLDPPSETITASPGRTAWSFVRPILSLLAATLVMTLLFPVLTSGTALTIKNKPGKSIGYGALVVFVAPIAALLLLISVVGMPIGFLSMLLYIVLIYLTRIFTGFFLADIVFKRFNKKVHPVWTGLAGVLVLALFIKIPYLGWLIHVAAVLFAAGALIIYLAEEKKKPDSLEVQAAD